MKKIISLFLLFASAVFVSCDDFLTVESPDKITSDSFWRNATDAEAGLAAAYSQLECSIDTWAFAEVKWPVEAYREDMILMGRDASNYEDWVKLFDFTYNDSNTQFSQYWRIHYKGLNYCNQVIAMVSKIDMDPAYRDQIINEATFLRGYYHMKLLLNWENIILREEYINSPDQLDVPLSERSVCWESIIRDLKQATKLPVKQTSAHTGRATSGAAWAYLGWAYLTRAYEQPATKDADLKAALEAFDNVKGYSLENNFLGMFNGTNENSKESVFELQFTLDRSNGARYYTELHYWIASEEIGGWDEISPSDKLVTELKKEGKTSLSDTYDMRCYATLIFDDEYFMSGNKIFGQNYDDYFTTNRRAVFRKFLPDYSDIDQEESGFNIPLMRYSNVLLMKAEVLNELKRSSEAVTLINDIRLVHGNMPAMTGSSYDAVKAQIEHERIVEFPLENFRFYDLRRWGTAKSALESVGRTNFDASKHNFYPIPRTELNSNNAL